MEKALERAAGFLDACGSPLDRARLAALRGGSAAPARGALEALQHPDGSFPALPGWLPDTAPSTTAVGLAVLVELGVRRAPAVERAVAFLAGSQEPDGSWPEARGASRLATTGRVGAVLGQSVYVRPEVLAAAGAFLAQDFAPERVEGDQWEALAGVAAFFTNVDHERADDVLQWCGRALEKGFRGGLFSARQSACVLSLCDTAGLPGARVEPFELVLGLLAEQDADGGWPADETTSGGRSQATLEAATALLRLGRSTAAEPPRG